MPRRYENPPLIEALCEFRFKPSRPWDWTVPGLFYERVKAGFPEKQQQHVVAMAIEQAEDRITQNVKGGIGRMQFLRKDRTALVQVGPDQLVVNQLKPYESWEAFREMILQQLSAYRNVAEPEALTRVGLRYINRLDMGADQIELNDYFRTAPNLPPPIPQLFGAFMVAVDVIHPTPEMVLRFIFTRPETKAEGHEEGFLLDLDIGTPEGALPILDEVESWLDKAHERLEQAFDAALTEKTHLEVCQEIK